MAQRSLATGRYVSHDSRHDSCAAALQNLRVRAVSHARDELHDCVSTVAGARSARRSSDADGWRGATPAIARSHGVDMTAPGVTEPPRLRSRCRLLPRREERVLARFG